MGPHGNRVVADARRVAHAGSSLLVIGVVVAVVGAGAAGVVAAQSSAELGERIAIGAGGGLGALFVGLVIATQGLLLRILGGYVEARSDPVTRPASVTRIGTARPTPGQAAAAASGPRAVPKPAPAVPPSRATGVAVAKPTGSGLRPPARTS